MPVKTERNSDKLACDIVYGIGFGTAWVSHVVAGKSMARMNKYKTASTMQMRPFRLSFFKSHTPRTRHAKEQQTQSTAKIRKPNCESNRMENADAIPAIPNNKMSSAGGKSIRMLVCVSTFMVRKQLNDLSSTTVLDITVSTWTVTSDNQPAQKKQ